MNVAPEKAATFTPAERDYIRRELHMFFSSYPTVAEGFQLKTWRGGPQAGQPKLSPSAKTLLERGLMRLDATTRIPRLFFTAEGLDALRLMMADRAARKSREVRPRETGARPGKVSTIGLQRIRGYVAGSAGKPIYRWTSEIGAKPTLVAMRRDAREQPQTSDLQTGQAWIGVTGEHRANNFHPP